ncbi:YceI family protein [Pistricoccus aurantiacus]|uniref:YceI family protein n=1 Tax=Pistricoccus aurantiacus TaxID=1883414 RepID=A0A5B8SUE4_9GAMM|nr:YceI family protein [Pistricoccus aurantiacus]QEA40346.1 YceI family protein [Pistricoccus aurantiacus]
MLKRIPMMALAGLALPISLQAQAADYVIDIEGQHAFVQFKISHLGFSYILGAFEDFDGNFSYDPENLEASSVDIKVDIDSLNTNHAERDKHILGDDFLDAGQYPTATFTSTGFTSTGEGEGELTGDLTLHGETREITMDVTHVGGGEDPWGGYREGFEGSSTLVLEDYGIDMSDFPEVMHELELYVTFEGIRQ